MRKVYSLVDRVAATDLDVLISGEAGVGKEVIARRIHRLSKRTRKAFVKVETGRLESSFWAGRLLGLRPFVAWTAMAGRDGGTIYFDEVAELHPVAQASMLQLILDRDSRRTDAVGSARPEARILASTRRDLWREVTAGSFREDLFLRLHAVEIAVPPLRERPEDIPTLVLAFVEEFREALASEAAVAFEPSDFEALAECGWPGNVRELREFVRQVVRDGIAPAQAIAERRAGSGGTAKGTTSRLSPWPKRLA